MKKLEKISFDKEQIKVNSLNLNIIKELNYVRDKDLINGYIMIATSKSSLKEINNYQDAPIGMYIDKPIINNQLLYLLQSDENIIKEQFLNVLISNLPNQQFMSQAEVLKVEDNLVIGYCKVGESQRNEPYWCSYAFMIFHHNLIYLGMVYFNCEASDDEFAKTIEDILNHISGGNLDESINPFNALKIAELFSKDIIFNNDNEIVFDGHNHAITGLQFNSEKINDYPKVLNNVKVVADQVVRVFNCLEENDKLRVETNDYHKNFKVIMHDEPITGSTYLLFCAYHMFIISKEAQDEYKVFVDENLIYGVPKIYDKTVEFIATLRKCDGITGNFKILILATRNLDSPVKTIHDNVLNSDKFMSRIEINYNEEK